ncbi:MAG: GNAT family protein [Pseudomonadota bacterium]
MAEPRELGEKLESLPPNVRPDGRMLFGRHVSLERLDPKRHGRQLFTAFSADEEGAIWEYSTIGPFQSEAELIERYGALCARGNPLFYAIVPGDSRKAEGVAAFLNIAPGHGSIEIGYIVLGPALQNTTTATEALFLMMRHAMDDLGNRRLEWKCNTLNKASRTAAERLGFAYEGTFLQHMVVKGRSRDTAWYSLLDGEWPPMRAAFLEWLDEKNFNHDRSQKKRLSALTKKARRTMKR